MEYYSVIKRNEFESVVCEADEPRACYTEWSRSQREKLISIHAYIWHLEKQYWWTYLQGRNWGAGRQNRLVDPAERGEGGNWDSSVDICTLPCVTRIASRKLLGFPGGSAGKESACNVGDLGLIPGLGRSPGEENGYPLQYSGLENSINCTVHGVATSWTQLSDFHLIACNTGSPAWCFVTTQWGGMGGGGRLKRAGIHI